MLGTLRPAPPGAGGGGAPLLAEAPAPSRFTFVGHVVCHLFGGMRVEGTKQMGKGFASVAVAADLFAAAATRPTLLSWLAGIQCWGHVK